MKLTLHIDEGHAPALIQLLAGLLAKATSIPVEATTDPAPGHPELALQVRGFLDEGHKLGLTVPESLAVPRVKPTIVDGVTGLPSSYLNDGTFDANDPTRQRLPWPADLPCPPPIPHGKMHWVYRGLFEGVEHNAGSDREVLYWDGEKWSVTLSFSGPFHHIEAV